MVADNDKKASEFITGSLAAGNEANLVALAAIRSLVGRKITGLGMHANGALSLTLDNGERVLMTGVDDPAVAMFPDCLLHDGIHPDYKTPELVIRPAHFGNSTQKEEQEWQ